MYDDHSIELMPIMSVVASSCHGRPRSRTSSSRAVFHTGSESTSTPSRSKATAAGSPIGRPYRPRVSMSSCRATMSLRGPEHSGDADRCASWDTVSVPALHVVGVRLEVGAGLVVRVVEARVEVHRLDEAREHHGREGVRELAVCVVDVLGDVGETVDELLGVWGDALFDRLRVLPRSRGPRVVGAVGTELALDEDGDRLAHVRHVRRAQTFDVAVEPDRVWQHPAVVMHESEPEPLDPCLLYT